MLKHPLMQIPQITFVTIADVTESFCEFNHVIYNPSLPFENRVEMLKRSIKKLFRRNLSDEQLTVIGNETNDMQKVVDILRQFLGYDD